MHETRRMLEVFLHLPTHLAINEELFEFCSGAIVYLHLRCPRVSPGGERGGPGRPGSWADLPGAGMPEVGADRLATDQQPQVQLGNGRAEGPPGYTGEPGLLAL